MKVMVLNATEKRLSQTCSILKCYSRIITRMVAPRTFYFSDEHRLVSCEVIPCSSVILITFDKEQRGEYVTCGKV